MNKIMLELVYIKYILCKIEFIKLKKAEILETFIFKVWMVVGWSMQPISNTVNGKDGIVS